MQPFASSFSQPIRPLRDHMKVAGRAMPVPAPTQQNRCGLMKTQALDNLKAGEVYVASEQHMQSANWGGSLSTNRHARVRWAVRRRLSP